MRTAKFTFTIFGLAFLLLSPSLCVAFPTGNTNTAVHVSFEFPDGTTNAIVLTPRSVREALTKPLPKGVSPTYYKIDNWIYAALLALDLTFETETVRGQTTIVRVSKTTNGSDGEWIYYVNGIRSRYHINTQLDVDVRKIKFVFTKKMPNKSAAAPPRWAGGRFG
jgi:hypothetical protein